ncbi:MAG: alpha/beta hydrolase [Rhodocyclaceae bacterium]|nr:alpha/beta hydrolase [Rhodocyclaceae bacterium]MDQ8018364.1 alpha/beta hydrolase [Pseudomonadota bacterium]
MTPLVFGPPGRQLVGLYHPAESQRAAKAAVLMCAPYGHEAMRSQRFFRVLADRLARAGLSVLRFDYHGTGDSPGDDTEGEMDGWQRDIGAAHQELRRLADTRTILWFGARLGATLALMAAQHERADPTRIVLWDLVVDGRGYLDELRAAHVDALEQSFCIPDRTLRQQLARDPDAFTDGPLGFAMSARLREQIRAITPLNVTVSAGNDSTVFADPENEAVRAWVQAQVARELPVTLAPFRHPLVWTTDPQPNNAMVPGEALQRLLAELRG